jgi:hypothetical protein
MTLDAKTEATVQRWVDEAPPLSERQQDLIATAFHDALGQADDESPQSR